MGYAQNCCFAPNFLLPRISSFKCIAKIKSSLPNSSIQAGIAYTAALLRIDVSIASSHSDHNHKKQGSVNNKHSRIDD